MKPSPAIFLSPSLEKDDVFSPPPFPGLRASFARDGCRGCYAARSILDLQLTSPVFREHFKELPFRSLAGGVFFLGSRWRGGYSYAA